MEHRLSSGVCSGKSIEKDIETLSDGYLRALGEADPGRSEQVWSLLRTTEQPLCRHIRAFHGRLVLAGSSVYGIIPG